MAFKGISAFVGVGDTELVYEAVTGDLDITLSIDPGAGGAVYLGDSTVSGTAGLPLTVQYSIHVKIRPGDQIYASNPSGDIDPVTVGGLVRSQ